MDVLDQTKRMPIKTNNTSGDNNQSVATCVAPTSTENTKITRLLTFGPVEVDRFTRTLGLLIAGETSGRNITRPRLTSLEEKHDIDNCNSQYFRFINLYLAIKKIYDYSLA